MAKMTGPETVMVAREMAAAIAQRVEDPALWLREVRRLVEAMGFDVTRCIPPAPNSLDHACFEVAQEGVRRARSVEDFRKAIEATAPTRGA